MDKELEQAGFNVGNLTSHQKDLIMQPSYAPENYHHDGEVTANQAKQIWLRRLQESGLKLVDINRARILNRI